MFAIGGRIVRRPPASPPRIRCRRFAHVRPAARHEAVGRCRPQPVRDGTVPTVPQRAFKHDSRARIGFVPLPARRRSSRIL